MESKKNLSRTEILRQIIELSGIVTDLREHTLQSALIPERKAYLEGEFHRISEILGNLIERI